MRADVFLKIGDHLFSMVNVLEDEEDGQGQAEQTDQPENDLKTEAFIKLYLPHSISYLSRPEKGKVNETVLILGIRHKILSMEPLRTTTPLSWKQFLPRSLGSLPFLRIDWESLAVSANPFTREVFNPMGILCQETETFCGKLFVDVGYFT